METCSVWIRLVLNIWWACGAKNIDVGGPAAKPGEKPEPEIKKYVSYIEFTAEYFSMNTNAMEPLDHQKE